MADKTMEKIKSGRGLQPLPSSNNSNRQSGITSEQRSGTTYEIFTYRGEKKTE